MSVVDGLILFLMAAIASFLGSVQAGVVNTTVLRSSAKAGFRAGLPIAIGGAVAEVIYAGLAAWQVWTNGAWLLQLHADTTKVLLASLGILIGAYLVWTGWRMDPSDLEKATAPATSEKSSQPASEAPPTLLTGILRGLSLGMVNLQLFPFWLGFGLAAMSGSLGSVQSTTVAVLSMGMGAGIGAFGLLILAARYGSVLAQRHQRQEESSGDKVGWNPITVWTWIGRAIIGFGLLLGLSGSWQMFQQFR